MGGEVSNDKTLMPPARIGQRWWFLPDRRRMRHVRAHPLQRRHLIFQGEVAGTAVDRFARQIRMGIEAKNSQSIIQRNQNHTLLDQFLARE